MKRLKTELTFLLVIALVVSSTSFGFGRIKANAVNYVSNGEFVVQLKTMNTTCADAAPGSDSDFAFRILDRNDNVLFTSSTLDTADDDFGAGDTNTFTAANGAANLNQVPITKNIYKFQIIMTRLVNDWNADWAKIYYVVNGTNTLVGNWEGDQNLAAVGDSFIFNCNWTFESHSHALTFNANGGTGGGVFDAVYGQPIDAVAVGRPGYSFAGWSPSIPATMPDANVTYSAQWTAINYNIAYNGNGSTGGSTASSSHTYDIAKALTNNGFTKAGATFAGWATSAGGAAVFSNGQTVSNLTMLNGITVTLYAVWNSTPVTLSAKAGSSTIINQTKGFIFGLQEGLDKNGFINNYVTVTGNGSLRITYYSDSFGSQTMVELIDNSNGSVVKTYYAVIFGDVDGDGYITVGDENLVSLVSSYQSSFDPGSAFEFAADLTQDELVDTFDLNLISAATSYTGTIDQTNPGELI